MANVLVKIRMECTADCDRVILRLGEQLHSIPYRIALEISQNMRVAAKSAASFDNASGAFWREVDPAADINDVPYAHNRSRESGMAATVRTWEIRCNPPEVGIVLDGVETWIGYETAIDLHFKIRRAARMAKAWAGDTSQVRRLTGSLTNGAFA